MPRQTSGTPASQSLYRVSNGVLLQEVAAAFAAQLCNVSLDAPLGEGLTMAGLLVAPGHLTSDDNTLGDAEPTNGSRIHRRRGQR